MKNFLPLVLIVVAGCSATRLATNAYLGAPDQPGAGVSERAAAIWGCDVYAVRIAAAEYRKELRLGQTFIPQVGWNACELLARVGAPNDYSLESSATIRSASLWYGTPAKPQLVTLQVDESGRAWRVSYVGWNP